MPIGIGILDSRVQFGDCSSLPRVPAPPREIKFMTHNQIVDIVVETSVDIHRRLGPGLLESVYCIILGHELTKRGLRVKREEPIPLVWDSFKIELGFRADLIVEDCVLLELKSLESLAAVHKKQVLTYLRVMNLRLGLLLNFGEALMKDGIHRIANGFNPEE
jgi:GxxExxY protein